ncbi:unnamed protein product [Amaranthus hypochondriacus]
MDESLTECLIEFEANENNGKCSLQESNTSSLKTIFNCANTILGNGVVVVPFALASGGWLSLIFLVIISMSATYTSLLVKRCMEFDPNIKSYTDIGKYAFGKLGKILVSIILYADLYMVTTGFLLVEGDNLHKLFPKLSLQAIGIPFIDGKSSFIIIIALLLLPTVLLSDNLSILAYISATGVLASIVILGSIFWVALFGDFGFGYKHFDVKYESFNWKGIPTAMSLYMLCYSSHPVLPALYTSMKKKQDFCKVLIISFLFCTFIYVSMAVLGYVMFGTEVKQQITLNLPIDEISSKIAIYTTWINPLAKYGLLLKPIVNSTEEWFGILQGNNNNNNKKTNCLKFKSFIIRIVLVTTQVGVAVGLPFFGYLMSLSGALLGTTASLVVPSLCYLKISSTTNSNSKTSSRTGLVVERFFIWAIICLGVIIFIFGTYTSIVDILAEIKH